MRTHLIWTFLTSLISFTSLFGASSSLELPFYGDLRNNGVTESTNVYMKFALIDDGGANVYWTNDGTGLGGAVTEPTNGVGVEITEGVFSVWLGDTTEANMVALGKTVFSGGDVYLRVWFSSDNTSFVALSPDKRMDSVPFSFEAFDSEKLAGITPGATGLALLDDSNAVTARATLGLGTASTSDNTDFASSTHTHLMADVTDIGTAAGNASSDFASSSHTHTTGEITGLGSIATQDQSSVTITGGTASLSSLTTSTANLSGLLYPTADGTINQVIVTDGSGNLSFSTISAAGGGANLVNNETILGDWDNTANPWADNEVANSLTISGGNVDNTPIGSTLPSTGAFTTLTVSASTNLGGLLMPTSDGTTNQVLITDGSGNLSWQSQSLGNDTISSANIVDGSITSTDIATGAVTSSQIQDGSISTADLADGAVTTAKIGSLVLSADNLAGSVTNGYFLQTDGSGVMSWTANSSPWTESSGNVTLASGNVGAGVSDPTTFLDVAASTTDSASLRIRQGTTPSSPNLGDVVTTDGNLRFYNGTSWINLSKTQASQEKSYFRVNRGGAAQSIPDATDTTIEWNTIDFDSNGDFDLPNYRFQPKKPGKYFLTASSSVGSVTDTGYSRVIIRKNGAIVAAGTKVESGAVGLSCSLASIIVDANGSTDYFDVYTRQETGGSLSQSGDATVTYFTGFEISGDGPWATSNGNIILSSGNIGAGISEPTAVLDVAASTTDSASLRIRQGTTPSSPNLGDVVTTDGNLRFYNGNAWINLSGTQAVQEQSYFRVTRGGVDQTSIPVNTNTVIEWTNKDFDSNSEVDLGTYRFQPKRSGKYFLTARAHVPSVSSTKYASVMIRKNGSVVALGTKIQTGAAGYVGTIATTVEEADGVSDYFDVIIIHEDTVPRDVFGGNAHTYFAGFEISNSSPFSSSNGNITLSSGNVGLNTSNPTSSLHTGGSFAQEVTSISSSYTADGESIFLVDDSGGNILIDLPAANTCPGRQYTFKKISAGNNQIILEPNGAETIDSSANLHIYAKNDIIKITNNGSNWYVIDKDVTPHRAKVICNSGVLNNVPDSSVYELTMDEIKYDNVGMADISGNGIRVKRAGAYHFSAHWWYNSNVTTETQIWVYVNGNYRFINGQTVSAANAYNHVSGFFNLEAGDLVTVHAVQKSGGSILLPADADGARGVQLQLLESP